MVIKAKDTSPLLALLSEAESRFRELDDQPIWSSYRDGPAIADFLRRSCEEIRAGTLSQTDANELRRIFAPTFDWDDCVGDADLGARVFVEIDEVLELPR